MKKQMPLLCVLALLNSFSVAKEIYQSIRVYHPTLETIKTIGSLGIPLDHVSGKEGIFLDITVTEGETIELISRDIELEVLIEDLTSYYKARNCPATNRDFPLGSMQGNYTLDELNERYDELHGLFPNIISNRVVIGQSVEGRDIWAFKVSDNPNEDEDEPEVLYTALTHSREPLGMMSLIYFVQLLAEAQVSDPELEYLINNREMWFVPVVNPDGYAYNEVIEPNGGGMHRKNRRDTGCGNGTQRGVDLNRNFGYDWGVNDQGSSPNSCSATYRGEYEFSEPETEALRDFILNQDFKNVLNFHTYANTYIHPFGSGLYPEEPDLTIHREIGAELSKYNQYFVGTCPESIGYTVNGGASDWTYGDAGLISFAPEVGSSSQGFWPPEDEVIELCIDQVHPNKIFSFVAGPDIIMDSYELSHDDMIPGETVELDIVIQNRGLSDSEADIDININALNEFISLDTDSYTMSEIDARDSDDFSILIQIADNAPIGSTSGLTLSMECDNSFNRVDTVEFVIGQRQMIFFDGFENELTNWILDGDWGLTSDAATGEFALTDSPDGDYEEGQETLAELNRSINLNYILSPIVEFTTKWDIESNWDFVRFQAYVQDQGWVSLSGTYTELGSGQPAQPFGEPGYDGFQSDWVDEIILLDQLNGATITRFRFIQTSDNFTEGDGFTIDDFSISGYPTGLMGDYNLDTLVDIYDLLGLVDVLIFNSEPFESQLFFCDLDGSGDLDVMDLVALSNIILGI